MNILVTGAAGFIAFHLVEALLQQGHRVVGIDNYISGQKENVENLLQNKNFSFFECDVINLTSEKILPEISEDLKNLDQIFHLACPASPPIYQKNPLHTLDTCFLGSRNVLELAKKNKAKIFLASTSEIYGDPLEHPQAEDYRGNTNTFGPRACYDEGKRIMETLAFHYLQAGVQVYMARIFNTYGPRMAPFDGRVLTNFIMQALKNEPLTVYGDGLQTRSFCYVSDLVRGILLLMNSDIHEPVNLGAQYEFSILELAKTVIQLINKDLKIEYFPLPKDDPKQRCPNTNLAQKKLNWCPTVDLQSGLKLMMQFMSSQ